MSRKYIECKRKQRHASNGAAQAHIRGLEKIGKAAGVHAYPCPYCAGWHVGHGRAKR